MQATRMMNDRHNASAITDNDSKDETDATEEDASTLTANFETFHHQGALFKKKLY